MREIIPDAKVTHSEIYSAAVRLFSERGYHGCSIRAIAEEVGVQVSSLYYYYPSKQQLLVDIMRRTLNDLLSTVSEATAQFMHPIDQLRAAVRTTVKFHAERREESFITDSELRALDEQYRLLIVGMRDQYEQLLLGFIESGVSQGVFSLEDPKLAAFAIVWMCASVDVWYKPSGRLSLDEIAEYYSDLALRIVSEPKTLPVVSAPRALG